MVFDICKISGFYVVFDMDGKPETIAVKSSAARLLLALAATILVYVVVVLALRPLLVQQEGMMSMMGFANPNYITLNILALLIGIAAGLAVYLLATPLVQEKEEKRIIKKELSPDEKALVGEVERAGEITQDSLRFRLGWSKAKVSTILTNLDRMGIIQRERQGKTYKVFLEKSAK